MHRRYNNRRYLYVTGRLISNANSKENIDINDNIHFAVYYLENRIVIFIEKTWNDDCFIILKFK